jgi:radical SAM superfamily enzyme YgiQ (UPF0313 family)
VHHPRRSHERAAWRSLLKRSGCFRVWIGAESGSQQVLDAMDRRVTGRAGGRHDPPVQAHGIETGTFIMLGYPGETEADIEATIDHLKRSDPTVHHHRRLPDQGARHFTRR